MKNNYFGEKVRKAKSSERGEAMPAAIVTAIVSSLILLGIASVVSMVVQNKSDSEGNVALNTTVSNIDVSLRSDINQASYLTAAAKLKQPTTRLLSPTDVTLSGANMHIPVSTGECKVVRWNINGNVASRDLTIYKSSLQNDVSVKCDETSPVIAQRTKVFAENVNIDAPFQFNNQVGRKLAFTIDSAALTKVNTELDKQLTEKGVTQLSDTDFNELNKLMGAGSYVPGFSNPSACVMDAAKVWVDSNKDGIKQSSEMVCPPAEAPTVAAAWNSMKVAKVGVAFKIASSSGEVAKRDIAQNSSVPLYANAAEAEASVADSSADNRPVAPTVVLSTAKVILGTNYTINWTAGGTCPTDMVRSYKVYENDVLIRTQSTLGYTKNYTNSATEFLNYNVQIECVRGALVVASDMSAVATAKVIPAVPALVINTQPAVTNAALNSNLTSTATCLYGTTPRYNIVQAVTSYGTANTTVSNVTSVNRAINNGFTVVEGARYQYRVESWCNSAYDKSTNTNLNTNTFTTVINVPSVGAPVFTAPLEGATNVATNVTVAWSAATCATGTTTKYYSAKNVEAGAAITDQIIDNWTTDRSLVSNNTQGNTVGYVVQARCDGTAGVSSGGSVADTVKYTTVINIPSTAPVFTSPAEGATNVATNATAAWSVASCPTGTSVQYYTTKNVNAGAAITAQVIDNWTAGNTLATNNTQGNTVGYTVAARCAGPNAVSGSTATDTVKFTTAINAPSTPIFTSPAEGATNIATNATVTWSAVTCPTGTTVQYYTTKNINAGVAITAQVIDNWTVGNTLTSNNTQGNTVGYTVAARCAGPNAVSSSTATDTVKYTTMIAVPPSPVFTSPAEGATNITTNATVTWSAITCPTGTTVQYYTTKNINNGTAITAQVIDNWTAGTTLVTNNNEGSTVGYTVAARCAGPNAVSASSVTDTVKYTTLVSIPDVPVFTSPANGGTNVSLTASVQWSGVGTTCATGTVPRYYMRQNKDEGVAITSIVLRNWTSDLAYPTSNTEGNKVGYAVQARCEGPNAVSSATAASYLTYTTLINAPSPSNFTSPSDGAVNVSTTKSLQWSGVGTTCAAGTVPRYYVKQTMTDGVAITPIVLVNWASDLAYTTANNEGSTVGYTVNARCEGPNAVSASTATDTITFTTLVTTPDMSNFTSPSDAAVNVSTTKSLQWSGVGYSCATGTAPRYFVQKNMDKGAAITPITVINWTSDLAYSTLNKQGYKVGYTVKARCDGPNAVSAETATNSITFTTIVNAPSAVTAGNNGWSNVTWSAPSTGCAAEAPIAYRVHQTKSNNNAVNYYASWTTGLTATLPGANTGGYPQWADVQAYCNGVNADSSVTLGANTTKWVKLFDVSFSASQSWRRVNVWGSCPVSTTVDSFNLYVAANGWGGTRGTYGGIYTDEGAVIADAQPGPGGNTGWMNLMQNVNSGWNDTRASNTTYNWGYWGASGLGAYYTSTNISATYWNASGWGNWAYWWTGSCETPYMIMYDKGTLWTGGGINNAGSPGTRYNGWLQRGSLTQAGVDSIQ